MSKQEGIEFNPIGTIDVTFDGTTYHLGRPKMRQFKHFSQALTDATRGSLRRVGTATTRGRRCHRP